MNTNKAAEWLERYLGVKTATAFPRGCGRIQVRRDWACSVCAGAVPKGSKVLKIETAPFVGEVLCGVCESAGAAVLSERTRT